MNDTTIHSLKPPAVVRRMAVRTLHDASRELRHTVHRMQLLEDRMQARAELFRGQK